MSGYGSVFLGDVQRHRILSTSTPPSSPPPTLSPSSQHFAIPTAVALNAIDEMENPANDAVTVAAPPHPLDAAPFSSATVSDAQMRVLASPSPLTPPPSITPALSLDLRIRWLETLVWGTKQGQGATKGRGQRTSGTLTLLRAVEALQRRLEGIVHSSEGLRRFMDHYDQHAPLLTPAFALSSTLPLSSSSPPAYDSLTPAEIDVFLSEMEPDIRAADRDLREIDGLVGRRDVTAAGKLGDHVALRVRLDALVRAHEEDRRMAAEVERRVAALMDRYATNVDALSELFVAWDDSVQDAERDVGRLARDIEERRRLGYE